MALSSGTPGWQAAQGIRHRCCPHRKKSCLPLSGNSPGPLKAKARIRLLFRPQGRGRGVLLTTQRLSQQGARSSAPTPLSLLASTPQRGRQEKGDQRAGWEVLLSQQSASWEGKACSASCFSLYTAISLNSQVLPHPHPAPATCCLFCLRSPAIKGILFPFYGCTELSSPPPEACGPCSEGSGCAKGLWSAAPPWAAYTSGTGPLRVWWPPFSDSQRPKASRKPILWRFPPSPPWAGGRKRRCAWAG